MGQTGRGIKLKEMGDVARGHRLLNLEGFLGVSFSAASFYSKRNQDPTLPEVIPKASDLKLKNHGKHLDFLCVCRYPSLWRGHSRVVSSLRIILLFLCTHVKFSPYSLFLIQPDALTKAVD